MAGSFQKTTIIVAGILLLVCIILLALLLYLPSTSNTQVWPPVIPNCPDYFIDVSGNGSSCLNPKNLGNVSNIPNFNVSPYIGTNGNCQKYNWATSNNLTWDGITYGVQNPCEALNTQN